MDSGFEKRKIAVLGAGKMGRSMASLFSVNGIPTTVYDPYDAVLLAVQQASTDTALLTFTTSLEEAVTGADFVLESAPEHIEVKRQLYRNLEPYLKNNAIVASNTSSYSLSALSDRLPFRNRMLITHFFNPADVIPLVEIVRHESTDDEIVAYITSLLQKCGKVPVVLQKDIPGFIANRLQSAVLREACFLLEQGVAGAEDIDRVVKEGIGIRWALNGPFEIADYGGIDIWEKVLDNLLPHLGKATSAPDAIKEKVKQNHIGVQAGNGFYQYEVGSPANHVSQQKERLMKLLELKKAENS